MGKLKATIDTAGAPAGDGDTAAPPSNVTPIAGRGKPKATGDKAKAAEAAGTTMSENEPAVVVFGVDDGGKAHASWFGAADGVLAERAAGMMGYRVLRVTTPDIRAKALELAAGRVFASGRGFVPFCKTAVYEALQAFSGAFAPPPPPEPQPEAPLVVTGTPQRLEDLQVGSLVLASTGPDDAVRA